MPPVLDARTQPYLLVAQARLAGEDSQHLDLTAMIQVLTWILQEIDAHARGG